MSHWISENNIPIQNNGIDDYVNIDNQVVIADNPSVEDIVNNVLIEHQEHESDEEEEEEDNDVNIVSTNNALDALRILRNFFETNSIDENFFYSYCQMKKIVEKINLDNKKCAKQTFINDYFK